MMIPFLILSAGRDRAQLADGIYRPPVAGMGDSWVSASCVLLETIFLRSISSSDHRERLLLALVGVLFGLPSLRIKGFYLAVATLAAQFFLQWCRACALARQSGVRLRRSRCRSRPCSACLQTGPTAMVSAIRYLVTLTIAAMAPTGVSNIVHGRRDADGGARHGHCGGASSASGLLRAKLLACSVVVLRRGVAGAGDVPLVRGGGARGVQHDLSFQILFMIIIGGLGSILGAFLGAAVIHLMPIALRAVPAMVGLSIDAARIDQLTLMITGALIIAFLIVEPHGLARLWQP